MINADDDLDMMLLSSATSKQMIFNFIKTTCLTSAVQCLQDNSPEAKEMADMIMEDIIAGYQNEDHSVQ